MTSGDATLSNRPLNEVKFRLPDGAFGDITLYEEEISAAPLSRDKTLPNRETIP